MFQDQTIAEITPEDIKALVGMPEGQTLEFKSVIPAEKCGAYSPPSKYKAAEVDDFGHPHMRG